MNWDKYKSEIKKALDVFEFNDKILEILKNSIKNNQKIFVAGNGGSAAIALHYVCDFSKGANKDWSENFKRYNAICLSSNIGYLTAISNDAHYSEVFKQQLINMASQNDILILISSSGNSPNIIEALKFAKEKGLITIGISGFDGGKLKEFSDYSAHINHSSYEVCEDVHSIFGHFLAVFLKEND
ncbi:SIS domain-containing protein [Candidatus Woesearchaeota archaeon]|nr:SIS domain-containing protein [Candidatus Woesearchaeota archaeon]